MLIPLDLILLMLSSAFGVASINDVSVISIPILDGNMLFLEISDSNLFANPKLPNSLGDTLMVIVTSLSFIFAASLVVSSIIKKPSSYISLYSSAILIYVSGDVLIYFSLFHLRSASYLTTLLVSRL